MGGAEADWLLAVVAAAAGAETSLLGAASLAAGEGRLLDDAAAVGLVAEQDAAELDAVVAAEEMMLVAEQGLLFAPDGCLVLLHTADPHYNFS